MLKLFLFILATNIWSSSFAGTGIIFDDRKELKNFPSEAPGLGLVRRYYSFGEYNCSGALVSPTLILTAGHCVRDFHDGSSSAYLFQLNNTGNGSGYIVERVVDFQYDGTEKRAPEKADWAILKLKHPYHLDKYPQLTPFNEATSGKSIKEIKKIGIDVYGFPGEKQNEKSNIPNAFVQRNCHISSKDIDKEMFIAKCDVSEGNSGGPVYLHGTNLLVGLVMGGEFKFLYNDARVFKIDSVIDHINDLIEKDFEEWDSPEKIRSYLDQRQ